MVGLSPSSLLRRSCSRIVAPGFIATSTRHHRRQNFVLDFDQAQRFFGDMRAGRGDGGDRVAVVEDLVVREDVHRQVRRVDRHLAGLLELVLGLRADPAEVTIALTPGSASALSMLIDLICAWACGLRSTLPMQHAREGVVGAVLGAAGDLVDAVMANRTRADNFEIAVVVDAAIAHYLANHSVGINGAVT